MLACLSDASCVVMCMTCAGKQTSVFLHPALNGVNDFACFSLGISSAPNDSMGDITTYDLCAEPYENFTSFLNAFNCLLDNAGEEQQQQQQQQAEPTQDKQPSDAIAMSDSIVNQSAVVQPTLPLFISVPLLAYPLPAAVESDPPALSALHLSVRSKNANFLLALSNYWENLSTQQQVQIGAYCVQQVSRGMMAYVHVDGQGKMTH